MLKINKIMGKIYKVPRTRHNYHLNCMCDECDQTKTRVFKNLGNILSEPGETNFMYEDEAKHNQIKELSEWWMGQSQKEIDGVVPKAVEYSTYALEMVGKTIADMIGWESEHDNQDYIELACWFYIIGKVGRAAGAIKEGRLPSDDTVHDVNVYGRMIARTREKGGWPN